MKHTILYLMVLSLALLFAACEQDMEVYHAEGNDRLNFWYENYYEPDTLITYTFIYVPEEQITDTIWFDLETSGYVTNYPRTISFEQMPVDSNAAVAGTHYVAFDDPAMKDVYVVPANSSRARVPLIMKKAADLASKEVVLKLKIKENSYFKSGFPGYQVRTVKFSNILVKPEGWTIYAEVYFAGEYGPVKHRFMIDAVAEIGQTLDEDWFERLVGDPYSVDMGETGYWRSFFQAALAEENAARAARGEGPLREAPTVANPEGVLVNFDDPRG